MFLDKIFKGKKSKEQEPTLETVEEEKVSTLAVMDGEVSERVEKNTESGDGYHEKEFLELATLLGTSVKEVKDDCLFDQIKKIMAGAGKVIVRYAPTKEELEGVIYNCSVLGVREILLAPSYLEEAKKIVKKQGVNVRFSAIIDFPFGESSFQSKVLSVKDMASQGVESISVVIPNMLLNTENEKKKRKQRKQTLKQYKKQVVKYNKLYRERVGIALSVCDITDEQLKVALKTVEKIPLPFITAVFGEVSHQTVLEKLKTLNKYKGNKKLKVLCNVVDEAALLELRNNGVDLVLSPYIDQTGKALVERFKIDGVKLK